MNKKLLAPCGINCAICKGYLREENRCPGCRYLDPKINTFKSCTNCIIKKCEELKKTKSNFCYECEKFPCKRMKDLNKRYVKKYYCPSGTICVHDKKCYKYYKKKKI